LNEKEQSLENNKYPECTHLNKGELMGAIIELLKMIIGILVWIIVIIFILWFLQGFWKGLSELVNELLGPIDDK